MTVREAASRLGLSPTSVYALIQSGELPCRRLGPRRGKIVVDEADVRAYWDRARVAARPCAGAIDRHARGA